MCGEDCVRGDLEDEFACHHGHAVVELLVAEEGSSAVGIVIADALLGEVTPRIALAVGRSRARKILLPYNRCDVTVIGTQGMNPNEAVRQAVEQLAAMVSE